MATKSKKKNMKKATAFKKAKPTTVRKSKAMTTKPVAKMASKGSAKPMAKKMMAKIALPAKAGSKSSTKTQSGRGKAVMGLITPLEDRVIVRVDAAEEKTAGGLYIPTTVAERPNRGEVVAAGRGRRNKQGQIRPLDVIVGDSVLFPQYSGAKITVDDQEFLILREDEVLGIVTV